MTDAELLRLSGLFFVVVVVAFYAYQARKNKDKRLMSVSVFSWMLHSFIFYIALVFFHDRFEVQFINLWSHVLKIQGYITLIIIGAF